MVPGVRTRGSLEKVAQADSNRQSTPAACRCSTGRRAPTRLDAGAVVNRKSTLDPFIRSAVVWPVADTTSNLAGKLANCGCACRRSGPGLSTQTALVCGRLCSCAGARNAVEARPLTSMNAKMSSWRYDQIDLAEAAGVVAGDQLQAAPLQILATCPSMRWPTARRVMGLAPDPAGRQPPLPRTSGAECARHRQRRAAPWRRARIQGWAAAAMVKQAIGVNAQRKQRRWIAGTQVEPLGQGFA